jgi:hypothetical protein
VKNAVLAPALLSALVANNAALAQAINQDDVAWINRCISDNRGEGASQEVVRAYCVCMSEKMDTNETRSVTAWERANPGERQACER